MNRWTIWIVTLVMFLDYIQMQNFKTINIVNLLIIHVFVDFNGFHDNVFG
jgi:hypothetical protein